MAQGPRQYHTQQIHFLRKGFTYSDHGSTLALGYIPVGSQILKPISGVHVTTVFNGGGPQTIGIGPPDSASLWGSALSLSTTTFVPCAQSVAYLATTALVNATVSVSGATAGAGEIIIAYIPDIDG